MKNLIKDMSTRRVYKNRKEAKLHMGHSNFNKALKQGQIMFVAGTCPKN